MRELGKKKRRGIHVEEATNKEILRKQLEMLAERSVECTTENLIKISEMMGSLYKSLEMPFCVKICVCIIIFGHFGLHIIKKLNELFRG